MQAIYSASVHTPAGWRNVTVKADLLQVSKGMVTVVKVLEIDGEAPTRRMSVTGAKRQAFDGIYFANGQVGARKRLSTCTVLEA